MVHWVFSSFGKHPVVNSYNPSALGSVAGEVSRHIVSSDGQHDTVIPSLKMESKIDDDFSSQRASTGSSTLNAGPSRAQSAESPHSISHNLRGVGEVSGRPPANFYTSGALASPRNHGSLDIGADSEPRPSWPLPESVVSAPRVPQTASAPTTPTGAHATSHRRSHSKSSRRSTGPARPKTSDELTRSSSDRVRRSHEHHRTHSRAGTMTPLPSLDELARPSSPHWDYNEHLTGHQTSGNTLRAALLEDEELDTPPPRAASQGLVQQRTSSRRAPTITSEASNLRDVDPAKVKGKAMASKPKNAHGSCQAFLNPRDDLSRSPSSLSSDSNATALPRFLYVPSNLEEQLEAARITQSETPPLSASSLRNTVSSRLATELYTLSYLIFFSIFGTLARLGLQALTFYPGAPVATSVLWSNFAGTFVLGFLAEDRRLFREEWGSHKPEAPSFDPKNRDIRSPVSEKFYFPGRRGHRDEDQPSQVVSHGRVKKTIPLFIGLATGFCGSFTSFSSFMRDAFLALSNELPTPISHNYPTGTAIPRPTDTVQRAAGNSVMAVIAVVLITLCLSIGGLRMGAHFAIMLDSCLPTFSFATLRRFIDPLFVFLGWGMWIGAIVMCVFPPDRPDGPQSLDGTWSSETWRGRALFACAFAPVGCLLRFYTSIFFNAVSASFPLGTFAVNIFGTAIEGMAFDLQHVRIGALIGGGRVSCQVLQGVQDGFCGSLTTISTWAAELNGLRRHHAYVYGLSSIICGLSLMVAIMGSVLWTTGWSQPMCSA